jgi:hypothetical protein
MALTPWEIERNRDRVLAGWPEYQKKRQADWEADFLKRHPGAKFTVPPSMPKLTPEEEAKVRAEYSAAKAQHDLRQKEEREREAAAIGPHSQFSKEGRSFYPVKTTGKRKEQPVPLGWERKKILSVPQPHVVASSKELQKEAVENYSARLKAAGINVQGVRTAPEKPTNQITETRRVLTKQRNAALVDEVTANQARQWGLNAFKVPHGVFTGEVAKNKAYIIYLPGQADKAKKVVTVLQKYPVGQRGPGYMAEIGSALGTPASETNEFIKTYYGEKKSGSGPAWLGVLGITLIALLLIKKQPSTGISSRTGLN